MPSMNLNTDRVRGHSEDDQIYDLVCVGFGPASLAIAVALHDYGIDVRVLFLERQSGFAWHAGMMLPTAKMQISFLKDLATFRDPRSHFTFLNYLKSKGRLEAFANLGTFLPLREEFNDYLTWAADHFSHLVRYDADVNTIEPEPSVGVTRTWRITFRDIKSGNQASCQAKNVVIAVGGSPKLPRGLQSFSDKVVHSSRYLYTTQTMESTYKPGLQKVAVIGGGQSAAELMEDLMDRFPYTSIKLFTAASSLKPSDDSPFVNEIFDSDKVDIIYDMGQAERGRLMADNQATNYSVVRPELLERLYEKIEYRQRIHQPDKSRWQHQVKVLHELTHALETADGKVTLRFMNPFNRAIHDEEPGFDLVFVGTGYDRNAHKKMLEPVASLLYEGYSDVERNYRLKLKPDRVDADCGIWLQGCCESSHGISDSLLSLLAIRGGGIVESIFGAQYRNCTSYHSKKAAISNGNGYH